MLILRQFFADLEQIKHLQSSNIINDKYNKLSFDEYDEYLTQRLDFEKKYARILRGTELISDSELRLLKSYYDGNVVSGINIDVDNNIVRLINVVESAI